MPQPVKTTMNPEFNNQGVGKETELYSNRFSDLEYQTRMHTWKTLCNEFLNKFISPDSIVLDVGTGDGHFIRNINCKEKLAVDLDPKSKILEEENVKVFLIPATEMHTTINQKVDVIFMSNFLEHLPNKRILLEVLSSAYQLLSENGKIIILQPNVKYVGPAYWDYIDHHISLTEKSLVEALEVNNFKIQHLIPRFLPYTVKSKVGRIAGNRLTSKLVSFYLKTPLLWKIFGKQTLAIATKSTT